MRPLNPQIVGAAICRPLANDRAADCRPYGLQSERSVLRLPSSVLSPGFTLIEILVVVSILAILGALVVPKIMDRPNEARVVAAKQDIGTLVAALKLYKLDNGRYPTTGQGLQALTEKPTSEPAPGNWKSGGYLEKAPKDPWGHDYLYLNPGLKGEIDVMSYGADGQQGGEGYDADIGSWM